MSNVIDFDFAKDLLLGYAKPEPRPAQPNPVIVTVATDGGAAYIEEWKIDQGLSRFVIHAHDANGIPWRFTTLHRWRASICDRAWAIKKPIQAQWAMGKHGQDKELVTAEILDQKESA